MPDIEERLRTALGALADEIEPAADPRTELAGRIDARRRAGRLPAIAAAVTVAAAAVVAVTFLPASGRPRCPRPPRRPGRQASSSPTWARSCGTGSGCARSATCTAAGTARWFLTDPRVATLQVRRGDGTAVPVTELDRDSRAVLYLADFAGPPDGFAYTATNAEGKVIEEAIT